jgi:hypothetical protein
MSDYGASLISRAFRVIPGADYNRTLEEALEETAVTGLRQLFYEVILGADKPWEYFRDKYYPTFSKYLKSRSISPENPEGVIVAVFSKDQCYLLDAQEFVSVLAEMEGFGAADLHSKIGQWLKD